MRSPEERRGRRVIAALAAGGAVLGLLSGCTLGNETHASPDPGTPLESYATEGLQIARADFCELIDAEAVERALGGVAASTQHYANGDVVEISPGLTDVAHEFNCTYRSGTGTQARAWVFAPPITEDRAAELVRQIEQTAGCTPRPGSAAYGSPTIAVGCRENGATTASFRGLFSDAWLTCSLMTPANGAQTGPPTEALWARADRWCAAVAAAAHRRSIP